MKNFCIFLLCFLLFSCNNSINLENENIKIQGNLPLCSQVSDPNIQCEVEETLPELPLEWDSSTQIEQ